LGDVLQESRSSIIKNDEEGKDKNKA
jgi:hypothetical protein